MRTYTLREAAEATGVSQKALRSRVDRGALRASLVDGVRRVPASELIRAGLLDASGEVPVEAAPRGSQGQGQPQGNIGAASTAPQVVVDVNALVARVEQLASDLAEHRLLTAQAQSIAATETSAREAAEAALYEARAELATAQAQLRDLEERIPAAPAEIPEPSQAVPAPEPASRSWWPFRRPKGHTGPHSAPAGRPAGLPPTS